MTATKKQTKRITAIIEILDATYDPGKLAAEFYNKPYEVLVSCVLSQRTRDENTFVASKALFKLARTPKGMTRLTQKQVEKAIHAAGFYREKAKNILDLSNTLVTEFGEKVPDTLEELLTLRGVGRKTANIVLTLGFGIPAIAVDIHVHRISQRLGLMKTKTPDETEFELVKIIHYEHWLRFNGLLVSHGREVCKPITPQCHRCPIEKYCDKIITPNPPRKKSVR